MSGLNHGHPVLLLTETELEQLRWALGALRTERDCAGTHALERLGGDDGEAAFESLCHKVGDLASTTDTGTVREWIREWKVEFAEWETERAVLSENDGLDGTTPDQWADSDDAATELAQSAASILLRLDADDPDGGPLNCESCEWASRFLAASRELWEGDLEPCEIQGCEGYQRP